MRKGRKQDEQKELINVQKESKPNTEKGFTEASSKCGENGKSTSTVLRGNLVISQVALAMNNNLQGTKQTISLG